MQIVVLIQIKLSERQVKLLMEKTKSDIWMQNKRKIV